MKEPSEGVTNLFVHAPAAKRYAAARPYFHPLVVSRICAVTNTARFPRALDVACGTGQSARALAEVSDDVDAVDISQEMITEAESHSRVTYQVSPAERMPFAEGQFDVMTVGLAFHWFDQHAFLREAARVLKGGGWLVVYNDGFHGEILENPEFHGWAWEVYPKRFPTPPRRSFGVSAELVEPFGFELVASEEFSHDERMTPIQLTGYLLTQTNVIAAVESGTTPLAEAAQWIEAGVSPFFRGDRGTMKFGGTIWFLRRGVCE